MKECNSKIDNTSSYERRSEARCPGTYQTFTMIDPPILHAKASDAAELQVLLQIAYWSGCEVTGQPGTKCKSLFLFRLKSTVTAMILAYLKSISGKTARPGAEELPSSRSRQS